MADGLLTQQQELFLSCYTNPSSDTFGNAYKSAIKAKYSEEYAQNITHLLPDWLSDNIGDYKRLNKAEKNLEEVQNISITTEEGKIDPQLVDKRTKVDLFIAERLGKSKYSARQEHTGEGGGAITLTWDDNNQDSVHSEELGEEVSPEQ